jgi:hypothetical protein
MKWCRLLFLTVMLAACSRNPQSLVPASSVMVYSDADCLAKIGAASDPLTILAFEYPDKTDYHVKVSFKGRVGYVCGGDFELK